MNGKVSNGDVCDIIAERHDGTALEFTFSRKDFDKVRATLYGMAGIRLADSKDSLVYSRLARRLRALRLKSFNNYLAYLKQHKEEEEHFINALTTNLTSFFREGHHFTELGKYLRLHRHVKTIWCAASSTGEEPYSIAMTVAQAYGTFASPVKIIASDIDSNVLQKASNGVYRKDAITKLPLELKRQFFHRGKGSHSDQVRVVPELRRMVEFKQINLTHERWPLPEQVDIIFCRNVMIYFDKDTQLKILTKMVEMMPADGRYFAGHSENFNMASNLVKPLGQTVYQPTKGR